jgi:hypothetical protein
MNRRRLSIGRRAFSAAMLFLVAAIAPTSDGMICIEADGAVHEECAGDPCCKPAGREAAAHRETAGGDRAASHGADCPGCLDVTIGPAPFRTARSDLRGVAGDLPANDLGSIDLATPVVLSDFASHADRRISALRSTALHSGGASALSVVLTC